MARARRPLDPRPEDDGDPASATLDELYRRHAGWLRAVLRQRVGRALASRTDDLVQETYVRAATIQAQGPIRHPRALLLRIAWRLVLDLVRARRSEIAANLAIAAPDAGLDQELQLTLKETILRLPPSLRDVFVLHRFAGLSYEEIAARLGVSVKTVEARMSKALQLCAASLRR